VRNVVQGAHVKPGNHAATNDAYAEHEWDSLAAGGVARAECRQWFLVCIRER